MIRQTHTALTRFGVTMSPSKVSRLVRTFKQKVEGNGFPFADYIANNVEMHAERRRAMASELRKVISYSDPTGETAIRNVLRAVAPHE